MAKKDFTHYGWFIMCPVYLNADDGEGMAVDARHWSLDWWFDVNQNLFSLFAFLMCHINHEYEPTFPFLVTGKIEK